MHDGTPGSTESARRIAEEGLTYHPQNWNLWERLALVDYQLGDNEKGAAAAKKAYELTGDANYLSLSEAIGKGIEFQINE
jgi:predicted Zn-dependent protease